MSFLKDYLTQIGYFKRGDNPILACMKFSVKVHENMMRHQQTSPEEMEGPGIPALKSLVEVIDRQLKGEEVIFYLSSNLSKQLSKIDLGKLDSTHLKRFWDGADQGKPGVFLIEHPHNPIKMSGQRIKATTVAYDNNMFCIYNLTAESQLSYCALGIQEGKTFKECFEDMEAEDDEADHETYAWLQLVVNTFLFMQSSNLRKEFVPLPKRVSKLSKLKSYFVKHETFIGHTKVDMDYHGREYTTDEWGRCGHWRWQPHGPRNSLLKLIFIEPTVMKRKAQSVS
jgi:hypothetical protein